MSIHTESAKDILIRIHLLVAAEQPYKYQELYEALTAEIIAQKENFMPSYIRLLEMLKQQRVTGIHHPDIAKVRAENERLSPAFRRADLSHQLAQDLLTCEGGFQYYPPYATIPNDDTDHLTIAQLLKRHFDIEVTTTYRELADRLYKDYEEKSEKAKQARNSVFSQLDKRQIAIQAISSVGNCPNCDYSLIPADYSLPDEVPMEVVGEVCTLTRIANIAYLTHSIASAGSSCEFRNIDRNIIDTLTIPQLIEHVQNWETT